MHGVVESVFKREHARVFAGLVRHFGDFDAAEDALQDAFVTALQTWPDQGLPERPAAWITTVAKNSATSALRHRSLADRKHAELAVDAQPVIDGDEIPDERLRLIFTCCHPALSEEARVALTLHTMCGVPTPAIARLFLVTEQTIAQRLVRAKRKIREANIPYSIPDGDCIEERVHEVLAVVYLMFTEGYSSTDGTTVVRTELCEEAIRLARVLVHLMPADAEVRGLLALMLLHHARRAARTTADGDIVAIEHQDRALWDRDMIDEGTRALDEAVARRRRGPYQIQAAIAAIHANARTAGETDWVEIAALYDALVELEPSSPALIARAVAHGMAHGCDAGLALLEGASDRLAWAARADLLRRAGRGDEAARAYDQAIAVARNERERRFLVQRRATL